MKLIFTIHVTHHFKRIEPIWRLYFMKIEFKSVKERQVAYVILTGHYNQIPQFFGKLRDYITENNIPTHGHPYCTFFNNTLNVPPEEMYYEIGIPVIGNVSGDFMIKIKKIRGHHVISTTYQGHPKYKKQLYRYIMKYTVKNGYLIAGPATEIYINNQRDILRNELTIELHFPVIKK